jgi:hypothetical protein
MRRFLALWLILLVGSWWLMPVQAARTISSGNLIDRTGSVITGAPFTVSLWFRSTASCGGCGLWDSYMTTGNSHEFVLFTNAGSPFTVAWQARDATGENSTNTGNTAALNAWNHVCAIAASETSRTIILNGNTASQGTNTSNRTPTGLTNTRMGNTRWGGVYTGAIAEVAVWTTDLAGRECVALANGASPRGVRRASLISYAPLWGQHSPEIDLAGPYSWTLTGTPAKLNLGPPVGIWRR